MINNILKQKTAEWLQSKDCTIKSLICYIRKKGKLRDTQIQAIEAYLFLKIKGDNKPLWQLFAEGFFLEKNCLKHYIDIEDNALYHFAIQKNDKDKPLLPDLVKLMDSGYKNFDSISIIKKMFYNVSYADYLMSLPMGAGKTFLMASFIYLDLYFANNEPNNKNFAHNFLILIPSGLKNSIAPSLRTINDFDPSWVLPEPSASEIKKLLNFDILDQAKTSNKSNKAKNPNAQKVNQCLPNPFGQIFVVNAEKVILNRTYIDGNDLFEKTEDEKDSYANDLRNLIGKIPNLSILIDEVHHATDSDIKLRKVVNHWNEKGNITTVLGFSGTPYLSTAEKIEISENQLLKFSQITNCVYYYPLTTAITNFLKVPRINIAENLDKFEVIKAGINDFQKKYKNRVYKNGNIAKVAIYCSNIENLEEEVYPYLTGRLKINPKEILRFHKGNKQYKLPNENQLLFNTLDTPNTVAATAKRYILLVQVGKEGWDCPSLTGIILSQKGVSSKNMVLQTSCRCLRQVDKNQSETAMIWLNEYNAKILNNQLKKEHETSISELNRLDRKSLTDKIDRINRIDFLNLPAIEFYQLHISYNSINEEENANTKSKLKTVLIEIDKYKKTALIKSSELRNIDDATIKLIDEVGANVANFNQWLLQLSKESFNKISVTELDKFSKELKQIFDKISYDDNGSKFFNELYDLYLINSEIRKSFSIKRNLITQKDIVNENAELLIVDKLKSVENNEKLFPEKDDINKILDFDKNKTTVDINDDDIQKLYDMQFATAKQAGLEKMMMPFNQFKESYSHSSAIRNKDRTFHYLPYDFNQSGFEKDFLHKTLNLDILKENNLEIYYNGERGLTEFVINCYAQENNYWKNIGRYTTDFLIIERKDNQIHKALIIETKGKGFANDPVFQKKKSFVETEFLQQNRNKFKYDKFDFLYLEDSQNMPEILSKLTTKVNDFFKVK